MKDGPVNPRITQRDVTHIQEHLDRVRPGLCSDSATREQVSALKDAVERLLVALS